ncbi:heme/hemin ABC transporter substrate-binding protein [Zavarzinia compransoris]|uniref:Hemin ABC transporter substrate-binding protein n=1 Tax=Zavarzinia compransoris TaxID=1264899 RepID=A0A317E9V5_9PROT|nr:ABC transporter substrate-binding protein [Zavarzinia compransoris]PWR23491.1 hemin ABC transporter substrate-binding protein [Zavarzinia compransoris]TDP45927.1 iron complex transport system substrate-binding protein [Zavarzinia compransoris]
MAILTRRGTAGLMAAALLAPLLARPRPAAAAAAAPARIISLDGSATEIFYLLGEEGRLVATDLTSTYPPAAAALPKIGYVRALTAEGIVAQRPDLILAPIDAGPPSTIQQLEAAGIPIRHLPDNPRPDGVAEKIRAVADLVGKPEAGEALARDVIDRFAAAEKAVAATTSRPKVLFLLDLGKGAPLAGGNSTSADAMIGLAGGINAVAEVKGFRPVSTEAIVAAAPDVVLVMGHVAERLGGPEGIAKLSPIDQTPAGRNGRIVAMDALYLLGFGPRSPDAVLDLARSLHPEMTTP